MLRRRAAERVLPDLVTLRQLLAARCIPHDASGDCGASRIDSTTCGHAGGGGMQANSDGVTFIVATASRPPTVAADSCLSGDPEFDGPASSPCVLIAADLVLSCVGSRGDTTDHIVVSPGGLATRVICVATELPAGLHRARRERAAHRNATRRVLGAKLRRTSVISLPSPLRYAALPDEQNPGNARMLRRGDICWKLAITGIDSPNIQACACL